MLILSRARQADPEDIGDVMLTTNDDGNYLRIKDTSGNGPTSIKGFAEA